MIYEVTAKNKAGETYTIAPVLSEPGIDNVIREIERNKKYTRGDLIVGARIVNDGDSSPLDAESITHFLTIRFLSEAAAVVLDDGRGLPLWRLYRALEINDLIKQKVSEVETLIAALIDEKENAE